MLTTASDLAPARLFAGLDAPSDSPLLVAVSGGGDSVALLALLARHVPPSRLVAATVDHGLRPGSAAEVEGVAALCRRLGLRHVAARWSGDKPASGLAAAARDARYRLLRDAAAACGATVILTGHTADDQAETVAMRQARGAGRGLAGMAPASLLDGRVWLVRPLLPVRREALRAWLRREGIGWADDPSNEDPRSERVRVRRQLKEPDAFAAALALAGPAARARTAAGHAAAALIGAAARAPAPGLIALDPDAFAAADRPTATYALRLLLATAGGGALLPDAARTAALLDRLRDPALRASLARVTLERRRDRLYLRREARGLPAPAPVAEGAVWDGRFRIFGAAETPVAPLGAAAAAGTEAAPGVPPALARAAAATAPAAVSGAGPAAPLGPARQPGLPAARPVAAPFARLLAAFDLAPATALLGLVGGELPPPPPYAGHDGPRP